MNDVATDKYGNVYVGDILTQFIGLINLDNVAAFTAIAERGQLIVGSWGAVMEG